MEEEKEKKGFCYYLQYSIGLAGMMAAGFMLGIIPMKIIEERKEQSKKLKETDIISLRAEDVNKDGLIDIVVEQKKEDKINSKVFYNDGKGNYAPGKVEERR